MVLEVRFIGSNRKGTQRVQAYRVLITYFLILVARLTNEFMRIY